MTKIIKQTLISFFAVVLFLSCAFMLSACGKDDSKTTPADTTKTNVTLTNEQCAVAFTATSNLLKKEYESLSDNNSSGTQTANALSLVEDSKLEAIEKADYSGVGGYIAFGISRGAMDSLADLHINGNYTINTIVEGDVTVNNVVCKVKADANNDGKTISGNCVLYLPADESFAYYVNYSIQYDSKNGVTGFEIYVYDNNAEESGIMLWFFSYDKTNGMLGYHESTNADATSMSATLTTAKTTALTYFGKSAVKNGYDFTVFFKEYFEQ